MRRILPLGFGLLAGASALNAEEPKKMNVLLLMSDDMRTDWNSYGVEGVHTPNLEKLAAEGVIFKQNYCQYPLSGPSRTSMLSGHYPTSTRIYDNSPWWGADHPEWKSLPMYFKENGYTTYVAGKIFHGGIEDTDAWDFGGWERRRNAGVGDFQPSEVTDDDHRKWIESRGGGKRLIEKRANRVLTRNEEFNTGHGRSSDTWGPNETRYISEEQNADKTIQFIKEAAGKDEPFFIACGFSKPHTPCIAPQRFFDLYDESKIPLPEDFCSVPMIPIGFPDGSIREINADVFINRSASPEEARSFKRAYWACISYVDWNVGRVLQALEESGEKDNTIIVFCSDHGFMLGEKGKWSKAGSLWEYGTKTPLVIYDPRAKANGQSVDRITELVDIYPTLVELCGLPENKMLDGQSFAHLLNDPDAEFDNPAYSVWNNHGKGITGVSIRTNRWRYAEFYGPGAGVMLIDEDNDPAERVNLANQPDLQDVVARFHKMAEEFTRGQRVLSAE